MIGSRALTIVSLTFALAATSAQAQASKSGPSTPSTSPSPSRLGAPGPLQPQMQFRQDFLSQAWTYHLTRLTGYRATKETNLANRVADLIDRGDCKGGEALARAEHDESMAFKVPAVCDAKRRGLL